MTQRQTDNNKKKRPKAALTSECLFVYLMSERSYITYVTQWKAQDEECEQQKHDNPLQKPDFP